MLFELFAAAFQVIGMAVFHPGCDGYRADFLQGITDDFRPAFVEDGLPGLDIPFPGSHMGAFDDAGKPQALRFQFLFHLLAGGDVGVGAAIAAQGPVRVQHGNAVG
ncbi:hypothetical protein SDC9_171559 [bioreactor metagenome]|uniref:Uncharacterized protein n=1 Tax=bioreactor metagenome TaxID=1076179 RepID=A0A645GBY8_9ZZZZ